MAEGLDFLIPSSLFMKGALIDNQRSSNKFAASGNRSALCLPGSFRRRGFQGALSEGHFVQTCSCRRRHSYAEGVPANAVLAHQLQFRVFIAF